MLQHLLQHGSLSSTAGTTPFGSATGHGAGGQRGMGSQDPREQQTQMNDVQRLQASIEAHFEALADSVTHTMTWASRAWHLKPIDAHAV